MGLKRLHSKVILSISMIISAIFLLSLSPSSYAESRRIQVVYTEWFPYTFQQNGKAAGFEIEILKAVLGNMNIKVEFKKYPWKRCLHELKSGKADGLVSMLKTNDREFYTYYPDTHISLSKTVLVTRTDTEISFDGSYGNLSEYSIGVIQGFGYGDTFDKADYLKKDAVTNAEMLIKKLLAGRNDIIAENLAVIEGFSKKMRVQDKIRFLAPPIHTQKLFVGFSKSKGLKKLTNDFSIALEKFKSSGQHKTIIEKYGVNMENILK